MSQVPNQDGLNDGSLVAVTQEQVVHHQGRKKEVKSVRMTLNLTSMIDVIFQLLIYFVITASFTVGEGVLTAKLPKGQGQASDSKPPDRPLNIILASHGAYECRISIEGVSETPSGFSNLSEILERLQYDPGRGRSGAFKPDNPVIIKPNGDVRWQHVVNAFNAALKSRYSNISFAQYKGGN